MKLFINNFFKTRYLIIYVCIILFFFPREKESYYSVSIKGDLSNLSHAYFFDIDGKREVIKIRYNANIAGNVLYSYQISKRAQYVDIILIFKDGSVVTGGWEKEGDSMKKKISGEFLR